MLLGLGVAGVIVAAVAWIVDRSGSPASAPVVAATDAAPAPDAAGPRATFVGSTACGECHEEEHAAWKKSWHAKALAPASRTSVVGGAPWIKRSGDAYVMRTPGADGALAEVAVQWVIGGKRMQDPLSVLPDGRWQILPVHFHVTGRTWVDHRDAGRIANHACLDCHTTGLTVTFDEAARRWTTSFVDGSVACESCHGPGGTHAESLDPADIIHPAKRKDVAFAACARCHGPRTPVVPLLDPERRFQLGADRYDEVYEPIVVTTPDGMSPEFFVDGRAKTSSFEYQALIQSACHRTGGATCLSCHTAPHEPHRPGELLGKAADDVCVGCHLDVATAGRGHTRHKAAAAQRCIACHMPPVVTGVLDRFADHAIDVPSPRNTERHGVPNACSVCHADRPAAALATALATWWPRAAARQARRERLADAFDEATAADSAAPLRAVIADETEAPTLRGAAAVVLGRRFGPAAGDAIVPLLASTDLVLRAKACEALGDAKALAAADAIAERVADPARRVQLACALALLDLGDPRGKPVLASLVELAAIAVQQGDLVEARARIDLVLALDPGHAGARALRARIDATNPR